jgi:hypothetical protein
MVSRSAERRARKEHRCGECGRAIQPGEIYLYAFLVIEGFGCSFKTCAHCRVAEEWLSANCGGWVYEEVLEEIEEHGVEYPALAERLKAFAQKMRAKWSEADGSLLPLPALPPSIASTLVEAVS